MNTGGRVRISYNCRSRSGGACVKLKSRSAELTVRQERHRLGGKSCRRQSYAKRRERRGSAPRRAALSPSSNCGLRSRAPTKCWSASSPPACATPIWWCAIRSIPVPQPIVLGHEGAGVVEKVGAGVVKVRPGDHVVLTFMSCGRCRLCEQGRPANCENFNAHNFSGGRADGTGSLRDDHGSRA